MKCVSKRKLPLYLVALGALLGVQAVHAHAEFEDSIPAANAKLKTSPQTIVLNFTKAVTPVTVSLVDAAGIPVQSVGKVTADGNSVVLPVLEPLPPRSYRVSFRVLSGDAHTVSGEFSFALTEAPPAAQEASVNAVPESPADAAGENAPAIVERTPISAPRVESTVRVVFIGLLLMTVGFVVFGWAIALPDTLKSWLEVLVRRIAAMGLLATIGYFAISTFAVTGLDAFRMQHLYVVLHTSLGLSLILAAVGYLLLAIPARAKRMLAGSGLALLVTSRVVTGHSASQEPAIVLVPSMAMHVAAAGFWFASLWVLLRLLQKGPLAKAPGILDDFARIAFWGVAGLLAAGTTMATVQLESFEALLHSVYGVTLLWKLAGVSALLLLAAINKVVLTPRLVKSGYDASALRASIRLEAAVMIAVIVLSTILAATSTATAADVANSDTGQTGLSTRLTHLNSSNIFTDRGGELEQ